TSCSGAEKFQTVAVGLCSGIEHAQPDMYGGLWRHQPDAGQLPGQILLRSETATGNLAAAGVGKLHLQHREGLLEVGPVVQDHVNGQGVGKFGVGPNKQVGAADAAEVDPCRQYAASHQAQVFQPGPGALVGDQGIEVVVEILDRQRRQGYQGKHCPQPAGGA